MLQLEKVLSLAFNIYQSILILMDVELDWLSVLLKSAPGINCFIDVTNSVIKQKSLGKNLGVYV